MKEILLGFARTGLAALAGWLAAKGYITADNQEALIGGGLVLVAAAGSAINKVAAQKKLEKAIAAPAGKAE